MNDEGPIAPDPLDAAFGADWLTKQEFPPVEYVVPGVIPEGLTLLTAAPKIGKSWMVLGLGVAAASGGYAFGQIKVDRRPVLYLALEDGKRRLLSRLRTIGVEHGPAGLTFMTDLPAGPVPTIDAFLDRHAHEQPLVILDTLGKIRGVYGGNDAYGKDYSQMTALKDLVDARPGSSLLLVHHTRKGEASDFLDSVSGTQGLAGAADSILVLRRDRHADGATLHVTSRDAVEGEYAVNLADGSWTLEGASLLEAARAVEQRRATAGVGDPMADLVSKVHQYPEGAKAADLATLLGWEVSKVRTYLGRACEAGRIEKLQRGLYGPVISVASVSSDPGDSHRQHTNNRHNTHHLEVVK
ncbi:helicase RepA family protein [Kocuria rhizophila]|uniref:AAA family ATPase n=1 Tax=Kocuria TaxID=57493 RepID=UPI00215014E2|nr:helicase RepA family protein [Kocuria rhizophila]MCR4526501.1 helicase RepA family protein [Kocuria rhizophila]WIW68207.1 helicase RepA family protein [Kocuria sp. ChxB]